MIDLTTGQYCLPVTRSDAGRSSVTSDPSVTWCHDNSVTWCLPCLLCTFCVPCSDILKGSTPHYLYGDLCWNVWFSNFELEFNDRVKARNAFTVTGSRELMRPWSNIYHYQEFQSNIKESKRSGDLGTRTKESILIRTVLKTRLMMVPGEGRLQVKMFRDWLKHQNVLPIRTNLWHFVSKC